MFRWEVKVFTLDVIGVVSLLVQTLPMSLVVLGTARWAPSTFAFDNDNDYSYFTYGAGDGEHGGLAPIKCCKEFYWFLSQVHIWSVLTGASETILRGHTSPAAAAVRNIVFSICH